MSWDDIFKKLINEGAVHVSYEANISLELDSMIGDIPIFKIKVEYFTETDNERRVEYCKTLAELLDIVDREPAFRTCDYCHGLICGGFYRNDERNEEYCSLAEMTEVMNEVWGEGNWRPKDVGDLFDEENHSERDEYQFEVLDIWTPDESKGEKKEDFDPERKEWRPYHMYYNPALYE